MSAANKLSSNKRISTYQKMLMIYFGGIETKAVTEFYGAPSSGRQHCIGGRIYMDTEPQ